VSSPGSSGRMEIEAESEWGRENLAVEENGLFEAVEIG
jgi:hypothetical protein